MGMNGHGNGRDPEDKKKVIKFPSLKERDRMKRAEREEEERWRKEYKAQAKAARRAQNPPFMNIDKIPVFTRTLIATLFLIHLSMFLLAVSGLKLKLIYMLGFMPGSFTGAYEWASLSFITPISHLLLHGGWMHLIFNSVMGLAFGTYFERLFGARTTFLFFILCGLGGALGYFVLAPFTITPVIGASGSISGLFGAILIMMMQQNNAHPVAHKLKKYGHWPILIFWGLFMLILGLISNSMAWQAHLGGYIAGIALFTLMQKGKIRL